jgi:hypothetical protein
MLMAASHGDGQRSVTGGGARPAAVVLLVLISITSSGGRCCGVPSGWDRCAPEV